MKPLKDNLFRKSYRAFLVLGLILIAGGLAYWENFRKDRPMVGNGKEDQWMVNNFKPVAIQGSIYSIDKAANFQTIRIKNHGDILSYGLQTCSENKAFLDFIAVGDSVVKQPNAYSIIIIKQDKTSRDFEGFYCP